MAKLSVSQSSPSGPVVIAVAQLAEAGPGYDVITPAVVMRPISGGLAAYGTLLVLGTDETIRENNREVIEVAS